MQSGRAEGRSVPHYAVLIDNFAFYIEPLSWSCRPACVPSSSVSPELGQVGVDERVEFAIHDRDDVTGFRVCPVVLDQGVGLEDVGADLVSPLDRPLLAPQLAHLRL